MSSEQPNDWRYQNGLDKGLQGVTLTLKQFEVKKENWDHEHCSLCWQKIMDSDSPEVERFGYTDEEEFEWICPDCFETFREKFSWIVKPDGEAEGSSS